MSQETGQVRLTFEVTPEDGSYCARCREIGTVSCGDTEEEAFQNVREATEEYIAYLREKGKLIPFLFERRLIESIDESRLAEHPEVRIAGAANVSWGIVVEMGSNVQWAGGTPAQSGSERFPIEYFVFA